MNTQDTLVALKVRRDLTGESFNDGTIAVWTEALSHHTLAQVRKALINAAKEHQRVSIAHVHERLPKLVRTETTPEHCEHCDATGWVDDPTHHSRHCPRIGPCRCHGVTPCRCTRGTQMIETRRRIHEANTR